MTFLFFILFCTILVSFLLSVSRFLNCLIILENFNVLLLFFSLLGSCSESHMLFVVLMVVSTVEVILGLVVLTRVWESANSLDLLSF
uniref:NADH dehydrogenase subunit 4L n=1 Tax=Rhinebothrium sp. 1 TaxID=108307 RepID=A0A8K1W5H2_9CEST|nr:NADH dehydrogenase subunit 4L [Rhinebothrium sp. 1]UFQ88641.1 NADH dehydrogenase subunit 4L [Rhinebothrium sp. 1]UFQ88665.1 NADH dehydrogenase subunit 4L [Rhinebothrium sp. 1]UFQ88677.1 NADH dehydrogenase subunit 4L [Rhinebothrium sp. 1]UFQ88689.1 NADH dehydrogenase subunit 4L [Rhinebothrium sp. 1]